VPLRPGDVILVAGRAEYAAQLVEEMRVCEEQGCQVEVAPSTSAGAVDVDALAKCLDEMGERVKIVSLCHVPTNGGLVNPAEAVGDVCRSRGVLYLLDACQSVGQMDVNVNRIGCDFLAATGRKFLRAPRGTGFLYARKKLLTSGKLKAPALMDHWAAPLRPDGETFEVSAGARRFEYWESSVAGRLGLGKAVDYLLELGASNVEVRVTELGSSLRHQLENKIPGIRITDLGDRKCGIVTFHLEELGLDAVTVKKQLALLGIYVAVSPPTSTALDGVHRSLPNLVRASVHYYNTEEEIESFTCILASLMPK